MTSLKRGEVSSMTNRLTGLIEFIDDGDDYY